MPALIVVCWPLELTTSDKTWMKRRRHIVVSGTNQLRPPPDVTIQQAAEPARGCQRHVAFVASFDELEPKPDANRLKNGILL